MIKKLKQMPQGVKSGIAYTLSILITKGLALITIPIFTRLMPVDQIGVVNIYSSWFSMISVVTTLSLTSGGYQLALKEFSNDKDAYVSSVLSITTIMAILFAFFCSITSICGWDFFNLPPSLKLLLIIGLIVSPAQDFWMYRQRFEHKYKLSSALSIGAAVFASALSIIFVTNTTIKELCLAENRLWANYIVIYGVSFVLWIYIFIKGKSFFNINYWKFSLKLSMPLVGHAIAKQVLDVSDRMMIDAIVGKDAVGIYSTLYSVSSVSLIVWNAINASYIPYLYQNIDKTTEHKNIKISSGLLLCGYSFLAVFMTYLAPEIVKILATKEYFEAIYIMPPIAMGVSLTAVSNMYSNVLIYYKKTKVIMIASISAAFLNLILNYTFISNYGYKAAAYTTLIAYVLLVIIEGIVATKTYKSLTGNNEMIYYNQGIVIMEIVVGILSFMALILYHFDIIRIFACIFIFLVLTVLGIRYIKSQ